MFFRHKLPTFKTVKTVETTSFNPKLVAWRKVVCFFLFFWGGGGNTQGNWLPFALEKGAKTCQSVQLFSMRFHLFNGIKELQPWVADTLTFDASVPNLSARVPRVHCSYARSDYGGHCAWPHCHCQHPKRGTSPQINARWSKIEILGEGPPVQNTIRSFETACYMLCRFIRFNSVVLRYHGINHTINCHKPEVK